MSITPSHSEINDFNLIFLIICVLNMLTFFPLGSPILVFMLMEPSLLATLNCVNILIFNS